MYKFIFFVLLLASGCAFLEGFNKSFKNKDKGKNELSLAAENLGEALGNRVQADAKKATGKVAKELNRATRKIAPKKSKEVKKQSKKKCLEYASISGVCIKWSR